MVLNSTLRHKHLPGFPWGNWVGLSSVHYYYLCWYQFLHQNFLQYFEAPPHSRRVGHPTRKRQVVGWKKAQVLATTIFTDGIPQRNPPVSLFVCFCLQLLWKMLIPFSIHIQLLKYLKFWATFFRNLCCWRAEGGKEDKRSNMPSK